MNLFLKRLDFRQDGIFGELRDVGGNLLAVTLEHAYEALETESWVPKVAPGTYTCVRHAPNRLPYETFMVEGVPDFQGEPVSGILFHCGNFDKDSEGCILVGSAMADIASAEMITNSKATFARFMAFQKGLNSFVLSIG